MVRLSLPVKNMQMGNGFFPEYQKQTLKLNLARQNIVNAELITFLNAKKNSTRRQSRAYRIPTPRNSYAKCTTRYTISLAWWVHTISRAIEKWTIERERWKRERREKRDHREIEFTYYFICVYMFRPPLKDDGESKMKKKVGFLFFRGGIGRFVLPVL